MKNLFLIASFVFTMFSFNAFSQSAITWIPEAGNDGNKLEAVAKFSGFSNQTEAATFTQKIKASKDVESCENLGVDKAGVYSFKIKMHSLHDRRFYLNWARRLGVTYAEINGQKKTIEEWLVELEKSKK